MEIAMSAPESHTDRVRLDTLQLVTMSVIPGAAAALARLNVFQALVEAGPDALLTVGEVAALAVPGKPINLSYLARLLRMMAATKILREVVVDVTTGHPDDVVGAESTTERRYALEPVGRFLVDDDDADTGSFLAWLLMFQAPSGLKAWQHIHESVLDDSIAPFKRAHGVDAWEYGRQNPEFDKLFNRAMAGHSEIYMRAILDVYRGFNNLKTVVDVGGGFGSALRMITTRYPLMTGINFDLPHVIDACIPLQRVEHVSGNMFESVPFGGDAIFMKYILHDWDDESCVTILRNCYQALPEDGKVIAVDHVLPEIIDFEGGDHVAIQLDILMLALNASGARERTERDFRKLGLAAGFKQVNVICKVDVYAVTEFLKLV